jgi:hypothetical protein
LLEGEQTPRLLNADRRIRSLENFTDPTRNRTWDVLSYGKVPQPTAPPIHVRGLADYPQGSCWNSKYSAPFETATGCAGKRAVYASSCVCSDLRNRKKGQWDVWTDQCGVPMALALAKESRD